MARPVCRAQTGLPDDHYLQYQGLDEALGAHALCACLGQVDLDALRELAWGGIPLPLRPQVWRLLCGYVPPARWGCRSYGLRSPRAHRTQSTGARATQPLRPRPAQSPASGNAGAAAARVHGHGAAQQRAWLTRVGQRPARERADLARGSRLEGEESPQGPTRYSASSTRAASHSVPAGQAACCAASRVPSAPRARSPSTTTSRTRSAARTRWPRTARCAAAAATSAGTGAPQLWRCAMWSERCGLRGAPALQVAVDVPRTAPSVPFFQQPRVQESLQRLLYIWGIR
jgi:hypothetical protein